MPRRYRWSGLQQSAPARSTSSLRGRPRAGSEFAGLERANRIATVDGEHSSCDKARLLGAEIGDGLGRIARSAGATKRDARSHVGNVVFAQLAHAAPRGKPWLNRIDADAMGCKFESEALGQPFKRGLRGAIGHRATP